MRKLLAAVCLLFGLVATVSAIEFKRVDTFRLEPGNTQTEELWLAAQSASVHGTVKDDLMVFADTIVVSGAMQSDVWALGGQSLTLLKEASVAQHARLLSQRIEVEGRIGRSLCAAGNSIQIGTNAVIKGDAALAGENVIVSGQIGGGLKAVGVNVTLGGRIGGNVRVIADDIVVMPGAVIDGDLTYTSSKDLFLDRKVVLGGQLIRKEIAPEAAAPETPVQDVILVRAFLYLCALAVALPFVGIFPHYTGRAVRLARQAGWRCLFAGFAAFCLMPMVSVFAFFTFIGIPLSILLLLNYVTMVYLSKIVVALVIGGMLLRRGGPQPFSRVFTALSLGLILYYALTAIPGAGAVVWLLTVFLGLGALVLAIFLRPIETESPEPPPMPSAPPLPPAPSDPPSSGNIEPTERKE